MKSISPAERYNFSTPSVIDALIKANPVLWSKGSQAMKDRLDTIKIVDIVRSRELYAIWGVESGDVEDAYCPMTYQKYVEETVIRYYS